VELAATGCTLVYWGSQWNNSDPSGELLFQQSFFSGVGGSSWNNSVTQYCQEVASGHGNVRLLRNAREPIKGVLAAVWYDNLRRQLPRDRREPTRH